MAAHLWRGDLATACAAVSPAHTVRAALEALPEVEQVFLVQYDRSLDVLTVIDQKDYDAMGRIFDREQEIIEALPGIEVSFDLVIRSGRPLRQVVEPRGTLLFAR